MSYVRFPKLFSKALCALLSVSISLTSLLPAQASAQTMSCNPWSAENGSDVRCGAMRIGGVPVAYEKLQWTRLSDVAFSSSAAGATATLEGASTVNMANRAALALGLDAERVVNAANMFPANVPYVFGRYNQLDGTLRIDIFKLEKVGVGANQRAGIYHAQFGPTHGDYWRAARAYISPASFKSGLQPGVNPFEPYKQSGSDLFVNISFEGAQVAMGHAMRLVGAPLGVFAMSHNRMSQTVEKGGNAFVKKTTTRIWGHAKPRWFIAQPMNMMQRPSTMQQAAICATSASTTDCVKYETATAGVSFEEFDGGTLSADEDTWLLDQKTKRGLGFLGALLIMVVASFALAALGPALGVSAGTGAGAAGSVTMGTMGSFLAGQGMVLTQFGAVFVEVAWAATSLVLAGANLSSTINMDAGLLLGRATVQKGEFDPPALGELDTKLNPHLVQRVVNPLDASPGNTLSGFRETVVGSCDPGSTLASCGAMGGMIVRVDQYTETNEVQFVRDNSGLLLRNDHAPGYSYAE